MKPFVLSLAAFVTIGLANAAWPDDIVAAEQVSGTHVGFVLAGSYSNATLSVTGPGNFHAQTFSRGGAVALDLTKFGALSDGTYNYQLTAASSEQVRVKVNDGRGDGRKAFARKPVTKSGHFNVKGGRIVDYGTSMRSGKRDQDAR